MILGTTCLLSCATKSPNPIDVDNASIVPAAAAEATAHLDANDNTKVKLDVVRLAPPENLTPPAATYVVWAQTEAGRTFMLGQLQVNNEGTGMFTSTAPVESFRLLVTGENDLQITEPSSQRVLTTNMVAVGI